MCLGLGYGKRDPSLRLRLFSFLSHQHVLAPGTPQAALVLDQSETRQRSLEYPENSGCVCFGFVRSARSLSPCRCPLPLCSGRPATLRSRPIHPLPRPPATSARTHSRNGRTPTLELRQLRRFPLLPKQYPSQHPLRCPRHPCQPQQTAATIAPTVGTRRRVCQVRPCCRRAGHTSVGPPGIRFQRWLRWTESRRRRQLQRRSPTKRPQSALLVSAR